MPNTVLVDNAVANNRPMKTGSMVYGFIVNECSLTSSVTSG
jgi:hypothetical protein